MQRVILSLVLGALIGGLAVGFFSDSRPAETPADLVTREDPAEAPIASRDVALATPDRVPASNAPVADRLEAEDLISAALRRHADEGLRSGWKSVREDEIPQE